MRPRLLALRALGLGDALTGIPALRALGDAFPDHRLQVAMPQRLAPLLELARVPFEVLPHDGVDPLPDDAREPDVAVNLHGRGPQSHAALLAMRPGRLVAFACPEAGHAGGPAWRAGEHEVERWCRLLADAGIRAEAARLEIDAPPAPPGMPLGATVIHLGAASTARRWPWQRWAGLAVRERAAGREVVITGDAGEAPLARSVAEVAGLPERTVLAGHTGLRELAGVVAAAGRVVCGDTGVAHLATALGRPSVVLFGPVPPAEWGPPRSSRRHRALWTGRRGDPHGEVPDAGLLQLELDAVAREVAALT